MIIEKRKIMTKNEIKADKYYSSLAIIKMGVLPWDSAMTFNNKLNDEKWKEIFKPMIETHKTSKSYKVKGENIIKFINSLEKGDIQL